MSFGDLARRDPGHPVLLQGREADGAEDLLWRGEFRQHALEVVRPVDGRRQGRDECRLADARRPEKEHVLLGYRAGKEWIHDGISFEILGLQPLPNSVESCTMD